MAGRKTIPPRKVNEKDSFIRFLLDFVPFSGEVELGVEEFWKFLKRPSQKTDFCET